MTGLQCVTADKFSPKRLWDLSSNPDEATAIRGRDAKAVLVFSSSSSKNIQQLASCVSEEVNAGPHPTLLVAVELASEEEMANDQNMEKIVSKNKQTNPPKSKLKKKHRRDSKW